VSTRYFGLDGEMTSNDLSSGGRLIQIGATAYTDTPDATPEVFSRLLYPGPMTWDTTAEAVHGFTLEQVHAATPADDVDDALYDWLTAHGADPAHPQRTVAVGFNVGTFDLPFLAETLPRSFALFSYRALDLNSALMLLDGATYNGQTFSFDQWKDLAKRYAAHALARTPHAGAHDAGWDAQEAVHILRFLRSVQTGTPLPVPAEPLPLPAAQRAAQAVLNAHPSPLAAAEATGVPPEFLVQWARGGRATNPYYLAALLSVEPLAA
jgi:DNA polymerase III epsilon subunit-like protein